MAALSAVSDKVEKFILERDSFRKAVKEAFHRADLDGNGVIAPREVPAMSETMFDLVEKELTEYGIHFRRPSPDKVQELWAIADKNNDYVLNEQEFFEFYRQVVKYCAVTEQSKGFFRRIVPKMVIGFLTVYAAKFGFSKIPAVGASITPVLNAVPAIIVGPLIGLAFGLYQKDGSMESIQRRLFKKKEDGTGASTSKH